MTAPLYRLEGVEKYHQGRLALSLPYLAIAPGRITVISGPNGAGKTTLLNMLAFLSMPDQGRLWFQGREALGGTVLRELRRQVTLVAQDAYLFNASVTRNLAYGLKLRGLSAQERRVRADKALQTVGLAGFGPRKARELSSGESQRVALARALALEPKALLLDEPFSSLDPESEAVFERVIQGLPQAGHSVVLVTHGREQARRLAHDQLLVENGRLRPA